MPYLPNKTESDFRAEVSVLIFLFPTAPNTYVADTKYLLKERKRWGERKEGRKVSSLILSMFVSLFFHLKTT